MWPRSVSRQRRFCRLWVRCTPVLRLEFVVLAVGPSIQVVAHALYCTLDLGLHTAGAVGHRQTLSGVRIVGAAQTHVHTTNIRKSDSCEKLLHGPVLAEIESRVDIAEGRQLASGQQG